MLCYAIAYSDLVGVESSAHFHGPASAGRNASVQFSISPSPSPVGSPKTGCVVPLDMQQEKDLLMGLWYINVHSTQFGGGEIRGQVLSVKGAKQAEGETVADDN